MRAEGRVTVAMVAGSVEAAKGEGERAAGSVAEGSVEEARVEVMAAATREAVAGRPHSQPVFTRRTKFGLLA